MPIYLYSAIALLLLAESGRASSPDELAVKQVVTAGNEAWIAASAALDPTPLQEWFRDQALVDFTKDCARGRELGLSIRLEPPQTVLESVTIDIVKSEATVLTTEVWAGTGYDLHSGKCLSRNGPNRSRVTYLLKQEGGRWKIASVANEPLGERTGLRPCDAPEPAPR